LATRGLDCRLRGFSAPSHFPKTNQWKVVAKRHTKYYNWRVKTFVWNNEKNDLLKAERQVTFEEVILCIEMGFLLDVLEHPNQEKYEGQKIFVVQIDDYVYLVPFVENEREVFLKTIIPSRKATKKYLKGGSK
jgi:hypothetical protein